MLQSQNKISALALGKLRQRWISVVETSFSLTGVICGFPGGLTWTFLGNNIISFSENFRQSSFEVWPLGYVNTPLAIFLHIRARDLFYLVIGNNAMLCYTLSWHCSWLWYLMLCCDREGLQLPDCYLLLESTYACMIKVCTGISAEFMVWLLPGEEKGDGIRLDTGLASIFIPMHFFHYIYYIQFSYNR